MSIIRILQEFGQYVSRTLHLLEQLMPGCSQVGISVKLIPPACSSSTNPLEVRWALHLRRSRSAAQETLQVVVHTGHSEIWLPLKWPFHIVHPVLFCA